MLFDDEPDHVLHPVAAGLQLQSVPFQIVQLIVRQAAAGCIGRQMLENTEGHLIDAIFGEISLQIVDARHFGLVGQRGVVRPRAAASAARRRRTPRGPRPTGRFWRDIERRRADCGAAPAAREA